MTIIPLVMFGKGTEGIILEVSVAFAIGALVLCGVSKIAPKKKNNNVLKALCLFLFCKTLFVNGVYISTAQKVISQFVFDGAGSGSIVFLFVLSAFYICLSGIESRGRMAEISAFFILAASAVIFALVFSKGDIREMKYALDIGKADMGEIARALLLMGGLETLYFTLPDMNAKKSSAASVSFGIVGVIILVMMSLSICIFGAEAGRKMWPVFQMMGNIDFPGLLLQRQDVLFIGMYIVGAVMFCAHTVHFMWVYAGKIFESVDKKYIVAASAVMVWIFCIFWGRDALTEKFFTAVLVLNAMAAVFAVFYMLVWGEV
ncbi:MAG: GerAB/ArcD/ProY family transporter [Firmicutes bacterium]|nr:GerAB/ArcD/ProY family transporter [Bacillota bacterium]